MRVLLQKRVARRVGNEVCRVVSLSVWEQWWRMRVRGERSIWERAWFRKPMGWGLDLGLGVVVLVAEGEGQVLRLGIGDILSLRLWLGK